MRTAVRRRPINSRKSVDVSALEKRLLESLPVAEGADGAFGPSALASANPFLAQNPELALDYRAAATSGAAPARFDDFRPSLPRVEIHQKCPHVVSRRPNRAWSVGATTRQACHAAGDTNSLKGKCPSTAAFTSAASPIFSSEPERHFGRIFVPRRLYTSGGTLPERRRAASAKHREISS